MAPIISRSSDSFLAVVAAGAMAVIGCTGFLRIVQSSSSSSSFLPSKHSDFRLFDSSSAVPGESSSEEEQRFITWCSFIGVTTVGCEVPGSALIVGGGLKAVFGSPHEGPTLLLWSSVDVWLVPFFHIQPRLQLLLHLV